MSTIALARTSFEDAKRIYEEISGDEEKLKLVNDKIFEISKVLGSGDELGVCMMIASSIASSLIHGIPRTDRAEVAGALVGLIQIHMMIYDREPDRLN